MRQSREHRGALAQLCVTAQNSRRDTSSMPDSGWFYSTLITRVRFLANEQGLSLMQQFSRIEETFHSIVYPLVSYMRLGEVEGCCRVCLPISRARLAKRFTCQSGNVAGVLMRNMSCPPKSFVPDDIHFATLSFAC